MLNALLPVGILALIVNNIRMRMQVIEPKSIYFNPRLIFQHMELWRLLTNFCFFGALGACLLVLAYRSHQQPTLLTACLCAGLDFLFHMFFSHKVQQGS